MKDVLHGIAVLIIFFIIPILASSFEYIWTVFALIGAVAVIVAVGNKIQS